MNRTRFGFVQILSLLLIAFFAFSCQQGSDGVEPVSWGECPDYSLLPGDPQCAWINVPLDYSDPSGQQIGIFAYRYQGAAETKKGQVWVLEGGPGGSGILLSRSASYLAEQYPEYDFLSLDHRGVGNSARLGCPGDNGIGLDMAAYQACMNEMVSDWGDDIKQFNTTNAARDIYMVTNKARRDDQQVFVYAVSYGTYWLQRYLQLYPNDIDGVILDSICSPTECYLDRYDGWNNNVGIEFMGYCADDSICNEKMETIADSPLDALEKLYADLEAGQLCEFVQNRFDQQHMRNLLGSMLQNWSKRFLIPALIYRMERCDEADQAAIQNLIASTGFVTLALDQSEQPEEDAYNSPMLRDLVALSELFGGSTLEQAEEQAENAYFCDDASLILTTIYDADVWDLYEDATYAQQFAETDIPILMMNGTTDPQTPLQIAKATGEHFTGEYQHFVTMPYATHGVMIFSPIDKVLPEGSEPCGSRLIGQFIQNPKGELDTSCTEEVYPLEFDPTSDNNMTTSQTYFGTDDMWEGIPQ